MLKMSRAWHVQSTGPIYALHISVAAQRKRNVIFSGSILSDEISMNATIKRNKVNRFTAERARRVRRRAGRRADVVGALLWTGARGEHSQCAWCVRAGQHGSTSPLPTWIIARTRIFLLLIFDHLELHPAGVQPTHVKAWYCYVVADMP